MAPFPRFLVSPTRTDTIASTQFPHSTLSTLPSEPPFIGPLNSSIAQRSSSSSFPTAISPFDVTSFTTDKLQSPWPSQPPSSQPPAQNSTLYPQDDFVLYPSPRVSSRQQVPHTWTQRANLSSSETPRPNSQSSSDLTFTYTQHPQRHSGRNHIYSGSLIQDPRVAKVISQSQGFSHSSSSNKSSPSGVKPPSFYAASAPSNSPRSNRPPLFSNNTENISYRNLNMQQPHRRIMSTSSIPQGTRLIHRFDTPCFSIRY